MLEVVFEDVGAGRLVAKLADHVCDLAAMHRGVIDDVEEKLPARDAPIGGTEVSG